METHKQLQQQPQQDSELGEDQGSASKLASDAEIAMSCMEVNAPLGYCEDPLRPIPLHGSGNSLQDSVAELQEGDELREEHEVEQEARANRE
jgi:hypothetical protein